MDSLLLWSSNAIIPSGIQQPSLVHALFHMKEKNNWFTGPILVGVFPEKLNHGPLLLYRNS